MNRTLIVQKNKQLSGNWIKFMLFNHDCLAEGDSITYHNVRFAKGLRMKAILRPDNTGADIYLYNKKGESYE